MCDLFKIQRMDKKNGSTTVHRPCKIYVKYGAATHTGTVHEVCKSVPNSPCVCVCAGVRACVRACVCARVSRAMTRVKY